MLVAAVAIARAKAQVKFTPETRLSKLILGNDHAVVKERRARLGRGEEARKEASQALAFLPPQREVPGRPALGIEMARLLVAHGADVNSSDDYPLHPLHDAIERYYPELVEFLLRHGARVEETRDNNWSPLWHPVGSGSFADYAFGGVHQYERTYGGQVGAEISREEAERRANRNRRTIALLLDAGADPMAPSLVRKMQDSVYSRIPFQRVCYWGEAALVRHMLRKGAKPNVRGPNVPGGEGHYSSCGYTALHCAALRDSAKNAEVVRILLKVGADPKIKDSLGRTPLDLARQKGNTTVVRALGG